MYGNNAECRMYVCVYMNGHGSQRWNIIINTNQLCVFLLSFVGEY